MNLPIGIAEKMILLQNGEKIPSSKLKHSVIDTMLSNGILEYQIQGRSKKLIFLRSAERLNDYLNNHFGISNLSEYISIQKRDDLLRADLVSVSADSKLKSIRTFKGFLVNSYTPIRTTLNGESHIIYPSIGTFTFIYDFKSFIPDPDVTIIGMENAENFRFIEEQKYLFKDLNALFISRYPQKQSKDVITWLQSIPNKYLHFGDFDLAGIGIYLNEYKKHLADRATFFIPENIEETLANHGSRDRYDIQNANYDIISIKEKKIQSLIEIIHKYKKGLDQEIFIKQ